MLRVAGWFDTTVRELYEMLYQYEFNVIPGEAVLRGTVRTFDRDLYERIPDDVERVIRGTCAALGAQYEFDYIFDSTKFTTAFRFQPTSYAEGVRRTAQAYQQ